MTTESEVKYSLYPGESVIEDIMKIMSATLSEPYSIYTYRYFLSTSPEATIDGKIVGAAVNRITTEGSKRVGNIGMVGVLPEYRKRGIGRALCIKTLDLFKEHGIKEVYLETEVHNYNALALYESLGFVRTNFLQSYYTTKEDAFRLRLFMK